MVLIVQQVVYPILKFKEEKHIFTEIEESTWTFSLMNENKKTAHWSLSYWATAQDFRRRSPSFALPRDGSSRLRRA